MSIVLSPAAPANYSNAADRNVLFSKDEIKIIDRDFTPRELPKTGISCETNLFFGLFFDGTRNNYLDAETGNDHSNVARLYDCFPGRGVPGVLPSSTDWKFKPEHYKHFFKVYVPGVGSAFPDISDSGTGFDRIMGGSSGRWGERRILWALVQAINSLHRFFYNSPLIPQSDIDKLVKSASLDRRIRKAVDDRKASADSVLDISPGTATKALFENMLRRLHKAVSPHWLDKRTGKPAKTDPGVVKTIHFSIFGFSRGATQARVFTNWLQTLCRLDCQLCGGRTMSLGGFPVQFDFLGIFDTVASVGLANTVGSFNGHDSWADAEDSLRIPFGVQCLHLVAAHELRRSFPLDSVSVNGVIPAGCKEIVVPGVHSDIGGGYGPREQGRGINPNGDDMLSRIPLIMMYKEARLCGVPLKLDLATAATKAKFAVDKETIQAYNAYLETCKVKSGPLHRIIREHTRKQIEWRLFRQVSGKNPLQASHSFRRTSTFCQNDLHSAGLEFDDEVREFLAWLKDKGHHFNPSPQPPGFKDDHQSEWEEIASWWHEKTTPDAAVLDMLDNYVHDSRATFKLSGPDNEKDMHAFLAHCVRRRHEVLATVVGKSDHRSVLTADEQRAADEYLRTKAIPRFRVGGREPWFRPLGLLGRAGYLRFRKIYGGSDKNLIS